MNSKSTGIVTGIVSNLVTVLVDGPVAENELGKILGKGVEASFSKKIVGGFRIAPKDGGYFISMTDETMKELIGEYLRPATRKILFG